MWRVGLFLAPALLLLSACSSVQTWREREMHLVRLQRVEPTRTHAGVWEDMTACLGVGVGEAAQKFSTTTWAVADTIGVVADSTLAYGAAFQVFGLVDGERRPTGWLLVLERDYFYFATTISHEALHILSEEQDHPEAVFHCELPSPVALPRRRWVRGDDSTPSLPALSPYTHNLGERP